MSKTSLRLHAQRAPTFDIEEINSLAVGDLIALRGARFFITGGSGYIGRWLLESICHANRFLNLGIKAVVLSRNPAKFAQLYPQLAGNPAISMIMGDVLDFTCEESGFTHVIHAATDVIKKNSPLHVFDVTVHGTRHVLDFARANGAKEVLLLSSGAVYGSPPNNLVSIGETHPCSTEVTETTAAYGLGKIATEWLGNTYNAEYGLACKSARIFAQIGPYLELNAQFAAGNFIRDVILGNVITIKGDGKSLRSYMYATDLVAWLWAILVRGRVGRSYNVGSDQPVSILELANKIASIEGNRDVSIEVLGQVAPGGAPSLYVPDTQLAQTELGLSISVSLEDALKRTIEWYRPQIQGYPYA